MSQPPASFSDPACLLLTYCRGGFKDLVRNPNGGGLSLFLRCGYVCLHVCLMPACLPSCVWRLEDNLL